MGSKLQWPGCCHTSRSLQQGRGRACPATSVHTYENAHICVSRVDTYEKGLKKKPFPGEGFLLLCPEPDLAKWILPTGAQTRAQLSGELLQKGTSLGCRDPHRLPLGLPGAPMASTAHRVPYTTATPGSG